ncbi:SMP-30/gluconolactonase/LRE family protein [Spirosoma taeanense]|uniref:SMP-30/gluconolactonase/LRE family protein n=1 Tax=Spirosoma taeanense TaxID=2735870 RepID=A0A6M5YFB1_9BACT|nr:SMP-30/gluconolactonase/LRE family protein [Spirosoma taeanense]QJW91996.1 SMP-30/gluconolactonase/LRE family protein [Spirosoma taeanense]
MDNVRILASGLRFPEGPVFDEEGCLWCVEQEGEGLFCRDLDGTTMRVHTGGRPNGAAVRDGYLWFCDSGYNAIRRMAIRSKSIETVVSHIGGQPISMPNDLQFDDQGNLVFTCPGSPDGDEEGYVAVYAPNGTLEIIADGLFYPNGLVFLPETSNLLISETHRHRIWQGYWDAAGLSWENIRVWGVAGDAPDNEPIPGPDGMTVGPDGNVYVAVFGAGIIKVFTAEGEPLREIKLPGQNPSNCVFDPSGRLGLVVTETEKGNLLSIQL